MRILHLIQRYWPARGGAEIHFHAISSRFAADGHQVTVATTDARDFERFWDPSGRRFPEPEIFQDGVRVLRFPVRHLPASRLAYPALRRFLWLLSQVGVFPVSLSYRLARFTPWVPALWKWLSCTSETFDIVGGMSICFEPLIEAGLRFAHQHDIPFIVYPLTHLGAGPQPATDSLSRFYTMRHQIALVQAGDAVVAQTQSEQDFYLQRGVAPERILVAGPGVEPEAVLGGRGERFRNRYAISGFLVASISTTSYDKGTYHLIEAVHRLRQRGRKVTLALAGAILKPFRRFWERLPSAKREGILLLGSIDDEDKKDLLDACDLLAMPSRTDSFGITYLEAWLYRKPVIGAQTWGVNQVIRNGVDGLLVPFGDVSALVHAIAFLSEHPEVCQSMGEEGERKVRAQHTWQRKYQLVRDLYFDLLRT